MQFERTPRRKMRALNLTPLIDVLFILIIFFMLTTSFMRVESMELMLPSAGEKSSAAPKQEIVKLFIGTGGELTLGQRKIKEEDMNSTLERLFAGNPDTRVMLLTADGVTMQQLVSIMDRIYAMGGKSLFVRKWTKKAAG